jgi:NAD+ synthase (glutamine-hydrolysing)
MRVGIGQINPGVGAVEANARTILARVAEAREAGCDLVLFPELALPGPAPLDLVWRPGFVEACEAAVDEIRRDCTGIGVVVGSIAHEKGRTHHGLERTPTASKGTEPLLRNRAVVIENASIIARIDKTLSPTVGPANDARYFAPSEGTQTVDLGGRRLGITLGETAADGPIDVLASLGAEWIIHGAASPFHVGKQAERRRLASRAASESGVGIVFTNCVGGLDGTIFDGGSFVVDRAGRLLFQAPRFEEGLFVVDVDSAAPIPKPDEEALSEMRTAIVLGLRDYVRKSGFSSVIVGVSGGIDSALVAALAVEALGPGAVTGVYLPCRHSSAESAADAHALSECLAIELLEISAEGVHSALRSALPFDAIGVVDENLQARARATLWMALANERSALVLATGNKSEIAVGYCTMYGDTTGALAPIADLFKGDVYRLAESLGDRIPRTILEKVPSAELRPGQRDDDDLPPYDVLDRLLTALIDENASRAELIERGFAAKVVDDILRRYYGSEFKRRQLPPGIALTANPLGGRRLPLTHAFRG